MFFMLGRKVLILLEVSVIKPASEVMGKIGDPKPINTADSKIEQQQQQPPQQNGADHNMSGTMLPDGVDYCSNV